MSRLARGPRVLGVDSGGSGLRVALACADDLTRPLTAVSREPVRTAASGIDPDHLLTQLLPMVRELWSRAETETGSTALAAVTVGAAGAATLGDGLRAELPGALAREFGVRRVALAADAVT
ncbi:ATPase, partial [Streptomyces sp. GXMU-J5]|nr:ATPase [Streptomyces beihaiensis]